MNWLPERNAVSVDGQGTNVTDKNVRCSLLRTPGLGLFTTLPKTPVRGLFPGEYRMFAVGGDSFYEIFHDGGFIDRSVPGFAGASGVGQAGGTIGNDGQPVQCFFNGNQAFLVSNGQAYLDSGNGPVPCQFSEDLNDLVVDPSDTTGKTLTTATGNYFDQSDVGRMVQITGPSTGGWNVGLFQKINSVDAQGRAIGSSAWGMPGAGLGVGLEWMGSRIWTDLQLNGPSIVYSASKPFGPGDIGTKLTISGGTGFTAGTYTIVGLVYSATGVPTGAAILDGIAGTAGSTGGSGSTADLLVTASQGAFLDGYFFVVPSPKTKTIYFSGIDVNGKQQGSLWNPLNFFTKANYPDNVMALFSDHQELYTMGDLESTQVWRDVGTGDVPFAPDPGAVMHYGCQAPWSVVRLGNGIAWIGQDVRRGTRRAYHAQGYQPVPVSTPAVEAEWARYTYIQDAVSYTYMDQGHELWVTSFPGANTTWVYDATTGWWHQRGYWNAGSSTWDRIRPWVHCVCALYGGSGQEFHYGGDWQNGRVYVMSMQYKTDYGNTMMRRRRAPHLTNENQRRFYARFEIDCDVMGQQRIFWNRLGNGRDRIWQIDSYQDTEAAPTRLTLYWSDDRTKTLQYVFTQLIDPSVDVQLANAYLNWVDATWH